MRNGRLLAVLILLVVSLPAGLDAQQPALTAGDIATIRQEVTDAVETYYRNFSEGNMEVMPGQIFHLPWIQIGGDEFRVDLNREESLARFQASLAGLQERGWGRSVYTTTHVCVLNAGAAITSGYNTRYLKDGTVMSVGGVSYILGRTGEGWRIVSYTGTPSDKVIRCD